MIYCGGCGGEGLLPESVPLELLSELEPLPKPEFPLEVEPPKPLPPKPLPPKPVPPKPGVELMPGLPLKPVVSAGGAAPPPIACIWSTIGS